MEEYYNLPIKYTEQERQNYAHYGVKKSKTLLPFTFIIIGTDAILTIGSIIYVFRAVMGNPSASALYLAIASQFKEIALIVISLLIIKPLDMLFDLIFKKPSDPMMLRMAPVPQGMTYHLKRGRKTLCKGTLSWEQWEKAIDPTTNEILIENQRLKIERNTLQSIYPPNQQHGWMDYPSEKIVGTIKLETIQRNMKGYLASLEEAKREAQWRLEHPDLTQP